MSDVGSHLFRATIEFALLALRTIVLVNGAAVIGIMTFVGHVWAADATAGANLAHRLFWPLSGFLGGLTVALVTTVMAYLTQVIITELSPDRMIPLAVWMRIATIALGCVSFGLFVAASFGALASFAS